MVQNSVRWLMKNFVDSLDVVLQIIKSQIKVIVLIARVDIIFFNSQNFFILFLFHKCRCGSTNYKVAN